MNPNRLRQTFLDLVAIDSPSGEEDAVAVEIAGRLEALGGAVQADSAGNVIASFEGDGEPLFLSAHMDTVQPGRGIRPLFEGDRVYTDGSTILGGDPKAGVSAILEGLTSLREKGGRHRAVQVLLSRGEEVGLVGSRNMDYSLVKARAGVVVDGEGAVSEITDAAPAQYFVEIAVTGRAAHAGVEPEKGISAIRIAAELILALPQGRLDEETTANIGIIAGGNARNTVPEQATVTGEFRSRDPGKLNALIREYEAAAAVIRGRHPEAKVELTLTKQFDGYRLPGEHPLLQTCTKALEAIGLTPTLKPSGGATDANIFAGHGLTAAVVGLGGWNFHTTREEMSLKNVGDAARFVEQLLAVEGD